MSEQSRRQLSGVKADGQPARIGTDVHHFGNQENTMSVQQVGLNVVLKTAKGKYYLQKHASQNYYCGVADGHKVHVTIKKITATVIWW